MKIVNLEDGRYLNENGVFTVSDQTNPYDPTWHTYDITLLANGKYAIQNGGSAGNKFWGVSGTRIQKSSSSDALPDKYIFDIIPLGGSPKEKLLDNDAVYYIKDGNRYLTNNNVKGSGGTPTFKEVTEPGAAQEWKITVDANGKNCYKITSNADNRYLNEYGIFGTNQYYSDWNTYLLTQMGDKWSLQWTQSAAKNGVQYLVVSDNRLEAKNVARSESYTVNIVDINANTSIEEIEENNDVFAVVDGCIICSDDVEEISIFTADGKIVGKTDGNIAEISTFADGLYIVVATGRTAKSYKKLIIK